jgi:Zn-dependent protease with chaperone function
MAAMDLDAQINERRALLMLAGVALPPGIVAGLIGLIGGLVVGLVLLVVVTAAVAAWLWLGADARVAAKIGGSDAEPARHARLINMVEGVCSGVGVSVPRMVVVDDAALNALSAGRDPRRAVLAVTSGLLDGLSPIELEGVVAEQLVRIRRRDTLPATLAVPLGSLGSRLLGPRDDSGTDLVAVSVTRYPPGLATALETMAEAGTAVRSASHALGPLWLADPFSPAGASPGRPRLSERSQALREL